MKKIVWLTVLFTSVLFFTGCKKDEDPMPKAEDCTIQDLKPMIEQITGFKVKDGEFYSKHDGYLSIRCAEIKNIKQQKFTLRANGSLQKHWRTVPVLGLEGFPEAYKIMYQSSTNRIYVHKVREISGQSDIVFYNLEYDVLP